MANDDLQFKVKVSADVAGLQQTEAALRDVASAAKEASKEGSLYTDEQKKAAQALADSLPPLKKVTSDTENLAKTLSGTKAAVTGLGNVLGGVFTGDVVQAGKGLLDLSKAAAAAEGAMATFLGSVARGAAVGAAIAAPLLIAMYKWRKEAEAADKEMQEIWANQGKSTKALADEQEAATKRMIANNEAIEASYKRNTAAIDEQTRATSALNAEKTKQAVAAAKTPEEKARIQNAAEIAEADLEVSAADQQQRNAVALGDPDAVTRTTNNLAIAREKRKTVSITQGAAASSASASRAAKRKEITGQIGTLSATAAEQQSSGDFGGQGETVAEIRKLRSQLAAYDKEAAAAMKATSSLVKKNTDKVKATREGGGN